jgi:hypothetical protein
MMKMRLVIDRGGRIVNNDRYDKIIGGGVTNQSENN